MSAATLASGLYRGTVMHDRRVPRRNFFQYKVFFVVLDLDELPALERRLRLFGRNRRRPLELRDDDHFSTPGRPLRENLEAFLASRGVAVPGGPVKLLTNLRVFGYVFNPVSFFWCYRPDGELACIVAEVNNTFGERLPYLFELDGREGRMLRFSAPKRLHVSPFMPLEQEYGFAFSEPGERVSARIDNVEQGRTLMVSTVTGRREPLTDRSLAAVLARYPLVTLKVSALIHWQAVRLWWKRVPFHRKPAFRPGEGSVPR